MRVLVTFIHILEKQENIYFWSWLIVNSWISKYQILNKKSSSPIIRLNSFTWNLNIMYETKIKIQFTPCSFCTFQMEVRTRKIIIFGSDLLVVGFQNVVQIWTDRARRLSKYWKRNGNVTYETLRSSLKLGPETHTFFVPIVKFKTSRIQCESTFECRRKSKKHTVIISSDLFHLLKLFWPAPPTSTQAHKIVF